MTDAPDWRSRRWAATHERIYRTALQLFQQHGFEQVSVGQIAAGAEVSVPTFYAHYPSKEHILLQVPSAEELSGLLADLPSDLPMGERIRRAASVWLGQWTPEELDDVLARWRIVAATPALRTRAAEFERTTAGHVVEVLPSASGTPARPGDAAVINAYLAAYTAGLLAWADGNGERKVEELVDEAFQALQGD